MRHCCYFLLVFPFAWLTETTDILGEDPTPRANPRWSAMAVCVSIAHAVTALVNVQMVGAAQTVKQHFARIGATVQTMATVFKARKVSRVIVTQGTLGLGAKQLLVR